MAAFTRQYNLRSTSQETVQLPVELHMTQDSAFLRDLLTSQQASATGQVSDESSINDSDCEALIASSDDVQASCNETENQQTSVKRSDPTESDSQSTSQQAINIQILAQLQSFGKRLDVMEKKSCKKSTDTTKIKNKSFKSKVKSQPAVTLSPVHQVSGLNDLHTLRQDVNLQMQVEKRLQDMASLNKTGTKMKSLRGVP